MIILVLFTAIFVNLRLEKFPGFPVLVWLSVLYRQNMKLLVILLILTSLSISIRSKKIPVFYLNSNFDYRQVTPLLLGYSIVVTGT